jgi:hypothetical protein
MRLLVRFLCFVSLSIWLGGFTFYSAVVIPVLHDAIGSVDTGYVTQRVTDYINAAGVVTLGLWWLAAWFELSSGPSSSRRLGLVFLGLATALLVALIGLHRVLDQHLARDGLSGFYPLHRAYLIVSTIEWVVDLALVAVAVMLWGQPSTRFPGTDFRRPRG